MTTRRVSRAVLLGFVLCLFAATPLAAQAAAGDLDASFGTDGLVTTAFDPTNVGGVFGVAVQGDGKIVAVGQCTNLCLARYSSDGTLDSSFGTDGKVTTSPTVSYVPVGVALQSDGKIVVAGTCSDGQTIQGFCVTRFSAAGSLEGNTLTKVVLNAGSTTFATSMALQGDGKIVVAGECSLPGTFSVCLARYNTDLGLDSSFGGGDFNGYGCLLSTSPGVCDYLYPPGTVANFIDGFGINISYTAGAVAVQSDGKIVVADACANEAFGNTGACLARYAPNGALDGTVITDIGDSYSTTGVALQGDGKIVVVGTCSSSGEFSQRFCIARYNSNLSLDSSFGTDGVNTALNGDEQAHAVALQSDGKIVVAGACYTGNVFLCLARYTQGGSVDTSFGSDGIAITSNVAGFGTGQAYAVTLQSDGKILAGGYCQDFHFCLARFEGNTTSAPVITPSPDVTAEATGPSGAAVSYPNPTATDAIDGTVPVICVPASGQTFAIATTTVDCTATNSAGNGTHSSFTVTVRDTTPPTITVPANISVSTSNPAGTTVSYAAATASDLVDGPVTPICAPASGSTFPVGTTTVNCSATDARGNAAPASFTVTVTLTSTDTRPPTLRVPGNITRQATGPAGALVTYTVTATDPTNPPAQITIVCTSSPTSGLSSSSIFPVGTTTITCNAHDPAGNNAAPKSFTVTVRDTTKPVISPTRNVTVNATGPAGAMVNYALPTATDIVDGTVPVICTPAPGQTFAIGSTTVTCAATDHAGNRATRRFTVIVLSAAQQISALKTKVNSAPELGTSTSTRLVRSTLIRDLNNALSSTQATACAAITKFIGDVQANTAPLGPITAANSTLWGSDATRIRAVRGC